MFRYKIKILNLFLLFFLFANSFTKALIADPVEQVQLEKTPAGTTIKSLMVAGTDQTIPERMTGFLGLFAIILTAFLLSNNRKAIPWRLVFYGTTAQFFLALVVLKTQMGRTIFDSANDVVVKILSFSNDGARFVFGNLVGLNVPVGIPKI